MRHRLLVLCVAAAPLVAFLGAAIGSAATAPRTVALKVKWTGSGTVRVTGAGAFACGATVATGNTCRHTFHVRRGRRIVVKESPKAGWKWMTWGGACKGSAPTCSLKLKTPRSVTVTFLAPGDRLNPYPPGTSVLLAGGWRVKINSATLNATAEVESVIEYGQPANGPPQPGAQYTLVNASITYVGGGSGTLFDLIEGSIRAEGAHNAPYMNYCIPPGVDLSSIDQVFSGQTETGNLCFEIASNDASTLLLTADGTTGQAPIPAWFALR